MIYGVLELLGSASRPRTSSKRKMQQFPLEVSCRPPGTGASDYFQFGRSKSDKNTFMFVDRDVYRIRQKNRNRVSRFSFALQGCADTLKVTLLATVVQDNGEYKYAENIQFKRFNEIMWRSLQYDCPLESGTIINTPGATFFWQDYRSLVKLNNELRHLNVGVHGKLLTLKFIPDSVFHIGFEMHFFMLQPCHHIMSAQSITFWTNLGIPQYGSDHSCVTKCPFCETHIESYPGYSLISI